MKYRSFLASVLLVCVMAPANAQISTSETELREQLLRHFLQDNLLPVFVPRELAVGDVLHANGALFARHRECFPALSVPQPTGADTLKSIVITQKAEGNFGIGLKKIFDLIANLGASSSTITTLTFLDTTVAMASTSELKRTAAVQKCPAIQALVQGKQLAADQAQEPLLVLQEVYYARKQLTIESQKGAKANLSVDEVGKLARTIGLKARIAAAGESGNQIIVASDERVPVAVRLAFVPRPITGATLGGDGNATIRGYVWEGLSAQPTDAQKQGLETILQVMRRQPNPLVQD